MRGVNVQTQYSHLNLNQNVKEKFKTKQQCILLSIVFDFVHFLTINYTQNIIFMQL